ncbi:MAG: serine/threonine-protein kinase [Planctomycetota bacterium]
MSPAPWTAGDRLDDLTLLGPLGAGGMGSVFLAEQASSGARFAVKALDLGASEEDEERFRREGQAQAAVDRHPNVVRVHRAGRHAGRLYLVLDLATGGDLAARLRAGPLEPRAAAALVRDLARGLEHVHRRGVLHRDLKPANVLFDERGTPQLVDFGLARIEGVERLTATGVVMGTPAYMAPEQAAGEQERVGPPSDVYGLGAVLYHALCGRPPFAGATPLNVLHAVLHTAPIPPRELRPEVPAPLEAVCLRALEKDPARRPASAAELADALEEALVAPAPARPRWPWVLLVAGLALAAAVAGRGLGEHGSPQPGPATSPTGTPPPTLDPDELARVERAAIPRDAPPIERNVAAWEWLRRHRGRPGTAEVEALLDQTRRDVARLWTLPTPGVVWVWDADRALHWNAGRLSFVSARSGSERRCGAIPVDAEVGRVALRAARGELLVARASGAIQRWGISAEGPRGREAWPLPAAAADLWTNGQGVALMGNYRGRRSLLLLGPEGETGASVPLEQQPAALAWSGDGRELAVSGGSFVEAQGPRESGWLRRFALPDLQELPAPRGAPHRLNALCYAPRADLLLVGTQGGRVRALRRPGLGLSWEWPPADEGDSRERREPVRGLASASSGLAYVVRRTGETSELLALDLQNGGEVWRARLRRNAAGIELSPDERWLLVHTGDGYEAWPALR